MFPPASASGFSLAGDFLAEILDGGGDLFNDTAAGGGLLQGADLLGDGGLVGRKVVGELDDLAADHEADAAIRMKASVTATSTAAIRGSFRRLSQLTSGVSAKLRRMARAKGMKMSRPK